MNQATDNTSKYPKIVAEYQKDLLAEWMRDQVTAPTWRPDLMSESELRQQSNEFLSLFVEALQTGDISEIEGQTWSRVREMLASTSRSRATQGFTPSGTAIFILSLKQPILARLREELKSDSAAMASETWRITELIDKLALYTMEMFQRGREDVIKRQQQEMLELSTPVVKLWDGILALPLIGTLDSERTQIIMESLLQRIVETASSLVIIDITGVPTVDTLVAQHLIKTVAAARLMGSDCIISGIRPQIAQTIVHLGVDLHEIITKATLADAFVLALQRTGYTIVRPNGRT